MKFTGKDNEYFEVGTLDAVGSAGIMDDPIPSELRLLWFQSGENRLKIDNVDYTFEANDIVCLTEFHKVEVGQMQKTRFLKWNKYFYCVINHDSDVGCKGILFYGAVALPVIRLTVRDNAKFSALWKVLVQEMAFRDDMQGEMLQMLLKRILILCTRMYKEQTDLAKVDKADVDIVREYHFLVEQHFKQKHTVAEYASMMHKSPKTLSNVFKMLGSKPPFQFIKDRKMLEARRLLAYTDKSVAEVGYELGFSEIQSFSRFFKREEGVSPRDFKR